MLGSYPSTAAGLRLPAACTRWGAGLGEDAGGHPWRFGQSRGACGRLVAGAMAPRHGAGRPGVRAGVLLRMSSARQGPGRPRNAWVGLRAVRLWGIVERVGEVLAKGEEWEVVGEGNEACRQGPG